MALPQPDEKLWQLVLARDATLDGRFVYAVATTGIYCRPSCPSRRPRRAHVRFFSSVAAAERAGFRACKRCRPTSALRDRAAETVFAARALLEERWEENLTLADLATTLGVSPGHLQKQFKERTGMSPKEYGASVRLTRFRGLVLSGSDLTSATYAAGFGSSRGLYSAARTTLGMTPGQYAQRGTGQEIAYGVYASALGRALIATTVDGFCAVFLGERDDELIRGLEEEFVSAKLLRLHDGPPAWVKHVLRYLADSRLPLAVPLDFQGTPFQVRVWRALRDVPAGETRTYSELAAEFETPSAARAVARACAQNTIAVLVPCHRVIGKDGSLRGYRWGVERKAALLEAERQREVEA